MQLLIAIPALNEEESIGSIIERCLDARWHIMANSDIRRVDITVVSDGSTDRTVEIASRYADKVGLIVFEQNRGYGAAITEAWLQSDAELLGFLDADGTCDPRFFATLCRVQAEEDADVVLGCRMNAASHMPRLRRIGNRLFAWTLSALSLKGVRDTASGMRVVRRSSLTKLFPLPAGLHFTPAMSARAMMSRDLRIVEIDMPYEERAGESKLNPIEDGLRFLRVILQTAFLYRPSRPLGFVAIGLMLLTVLMMVRPACFYLLNGRLQEWMIYRFLVGELCCTLAVLVCCLSYLGDKAVNISLADDPAGDKYHGLWGWLFSRRWFWAAPSLLVAAGGGLVSGALSELLSTGLVTAHWSRFVAMMLCLTVAAILTVTKVVDYCLNLLADRLAYLKLAPEVLKRDVAKPELRIVRHAA
jgi:hypothetical protein